MIGKFLVSLLLAIIALTVLAEIYSRSTDDNLTVTSLGVSDATTDIIIVFHGTGGSDRPVFQEIADHLTAANPDSLVLNYDWSRGSENRLRAIANGEAIGKNLGAELAELENLQRVQLIAHSVGASIPDALCAVLRDARGNAIRVETVFLDPFGRKGLFDSAYGRRNYGKCADFAVAYINTDDRAPTTNTPLENAYNRDVTNAPGADTDQTSSHYWPVHFFRDLISEDPQAVRGGSHDLLPRGEFAPVEQQRED